MKIRVNDILRGLDKIKHEHEVWNIRPIMETKALPDSGNPTKNQIIRHIRMYREYDGETVIDIPEEQPCN